MDLKHFLIEPGLKMSHTSFHMHSSTVSGRVGLGHCGFSSGLGVWKGAKFIVATPWKSYLWGRVRQEGLGTAIIQVGKCKKYVRIGFGQGECRTEAETRPVARLSRESVGRVRWQSACRRTGPELHPCSCARGCGG